MQQILEESGLTAEQVQLVRSGRPLLVDDGTLRCVRCPACLGAAAGQSWLCEMCAASRLRLLQVTAAARRPKIACAAIPLLPL